eukprot:539539-Rhodomonas_salina.4
MARDRQDLVSCAICPCVRSRARPALTDGVLCDLSDRVCESEYAARPSTARRGDASEKEASNYRAVCQQLEAQLGILTEQVRPPSPLLSPLAYLLSLPRVVSLLTPPSSARFSRSRCPNPVPSPAAGLTAAVLA